MNKKRLCESIINNVAKELKKALNEDFEFDDTEVADKLLELVKKDKQIQNIVKNANPDDWANVIRGMGRLVKSKKVGENPVKIANVVQLANAILNRCDKAIQEKLTEMQNEDVQYTANFLAKEVRAIYGEKTAKNAKGAAMQDESGDDKSNLIDQKNEGKDCSECGGDNKDNKKVQESLRFRKAGGFRQYLNEQRSKIRPGRK